MRRVGYFSISYWANAAPVYQVVAVAADSASEAQCYFDTRLKPKLAQPTSRGMIELRIRRVWLPSGCEGKASLFRILDHGVPLAYMLGPDPAWAIEAFRNEVQHNRCSDSELTTRMVCRKVYIAHPVA
jgi:hypothetical protein